MTLRPAGVITTRVPNRWRQHRPVRRCARAALIVFAIVFVAIIVVADRGEGHRYWGGITHIPYWDKIGHVGLLAVFSMLLNTALDGRRAPGRFAMFLLGSACLGLAMTLEELSQLCIAGRTFDVIDCAASLCGIAIGGWITRWISVPSLPGDRRRG